MDVTEYRASREREFKASRRSRSWRRSRTNSEIAAEAITSIASAFGSVRIAGALGQSMDALADVWIPVGGGLFALAVFEFVLRPVVNYIWVVPVEMHLAVLERTDEEKNTLQQEARAANAQITDLRQTVAGLQVQLHTTKKDQAFADALTERYDYGLHQILNWEEIFKQSGFYDALRDRWESRENEWTAAVRKQLQDYGCTAQVIAHFGNIHKVILGDFHFEPGMNYVMSMFSNRLERLKEIINMYSTTPILTP